MRSVSSPVLVGRDADLTELGRAFGEAGSGRPSIVILTGEAGIGKSRLVAELAARARAEGAWAVVGGCLDLGDGIPYLPFVEALRGLARTVDRDELDRLLGPARADFARVVPELIPPDPGAAVAAATEPPIPPGRLYEGVIGLVERVGTVAPALLAIEDVHWIDRASRDLITFLARNLASERVLIVLTARSDALPAGHPTIEWLAELARQPRAFRIQLAPLPPSSVEEQIEAILGRRPDPELLARVVARADGNPFFAEELVASASLADLPPPTLVGILAARLGRLSAEARAVVSALAIAGRPIDESLLAAVLGTSAEGIEEPIRDLRAGNLVILDAESGALRLRHVLLAEVALAELLPGRRRSLHEAFASAAHAVADGGSLGAAVELAWHWEAAERWDAAFDACLEAAAAGELVGEPETVLGQLERALDHADRRDAPITADDRVALLLRAAAAARLAGRSDQAIALLEQIPATDPAPAPAVVAEAHRRLADLRLGRGDTTSADGHVRAGLAVADPAAVPVVRADLLALGLRAAADDAARLRATRDASALAELARRAEPLRTALVDLIARSDAPTDQAIAGLATAEAARLDDASPPEVWLAAADRLDAVGEIGRAAYARYRAAEAQLQVDGVRADVTDLLRGAHRQAIRLGDQPLGDAIEGLARRARVALVEAAPPPVEPAGEPEPETDDGRVTLRRSGLSDREIEVLQLVAAGRTNGQIADRLFITRKTAGVHVTHILDKLGVANRVEAAMVAARVGLDPADDV